MKRGSVLQEIGNWSEFLAFSSNWPVRKPLPRGLIRHETDSELLKRRDHFLLGSSCPQRVFALDCSNWLDGVSASNCLRSRFRKPEVFDLTLLDQFLHRACDIFDGYARVHSVLIQQIDDINLQSLKRPFDGLLYVLGLAVHTGRPGLVIFASEVETKLGGDHHFAAIGGKRLAHEFFVGERTVDFGGVEESDAAIHGGGGRRCSSSPSCLWAGRAGLISHAAQADGRDFKVALTKFALLHFVYLPKRRNLIYTQIAVTV